MTRTIISEEIKHCNQNLLVVSIIACIVVTWDVFEILLPSLHDWASVRFLINLGFIGMVGGFGLIGICAALVELRSIETSDTFTSLKRFNQSPAAIAEAIHKDVQSSKNLSPVDSVILTSSWLLHKQFLSFSILKLSEIVWVYPKVTKTSVNFIPTGKRFGVVIADALGHKEEIDGGEVATKHLIDAIVLQIPWIISGYSDKLEEVYRTDCIWFYRTVQSRKRKHTRYNTSPPKLDE